MTQPTQSTTQVPCEYKPATLKFEVDLNYALPVIVVCAVVATAFWVRGELKTQRAKRILEDK